jgi:hypothetical protein
VTHGEELAWLSFALPDPYSICSRPQAGLQCWIAFVCFDLTHVIHDFAESIDSHGLNPDSAIVTDQRADCVAVEFDVPWVDHGVASDAVFISATVFISISDSTKKARTVDATY